MSRDGSLERLAGQVLASRYRVGERLGAGAMGTVFCAEHVKVGRKLAIKVLHPRMLENPKYRRRFDQEAELAGRMRHPNVAGVIDVGITPEGLRYLVMEYADGPTLAELIADGPMAASRMQGLARQLCDGLHHAHEHGLVHRDFKPDNVIVERDACGDETPRILDFGIALALGDLSSGERERLTTEGMVLGTPHYMAPEHASGQAIDHRIDLFALGVICYEMLTGKLPFAGTGVEVARAYLSRSIPPMQQRAPEVDVDPLLEAFTRALLARSRDERPASAKAARALLDLIASDRAAAAEQLGVRLHAARRTLPVSPAPPPGRAPSGTKPPAPWNQLPTEKMASDPEAPSIVEMDGPGPEDDDSALVPATAPALALTSPVPIAVPVAPSASIASAVASAEARADARADPRAELGGSVTIPRLRRVAAAPAADLHVAVRSVAVAEPRPPARRTPAREVPARRRRGGAAAPWIAAALCGLSLGAIALRVLRDEPAAAAPATAAVAEAQPQASTPPPAETPAPAPAVTAPVLAPPQPQVTAQLPAPIAPAPPAATAQLPAPAATVGHPPAATPPAARPAARRPAAPAVAAPVTPVQTEVPRADPQAAAVADLYGAIGRSLKRLDETHGQDATFDLWPRFRLIHIFEALRTRDGRLEAHEALRYLEREIARRSR